MASIPDHGGVGRAGKRKRRSGMKKRRWAGSLVRLTGSAVLLAVLVSLIDLKALLSLVGRIDSLWLAAAAVILLALRFLMALRWHYIMSRHDIPAGLGEAVRVTFLATTLAPLFPGGLGGDLYRGYYIVKKYGKAAVVAATVLLDRFVGIYSMLLLASLGAVAAWWTGRTGERLLPGLVLLQIVIAVAWGVAVLVRNNLARWRPRGRLLGKLWRQFIAVLLNLTDLPLLRRIALGMIALSIVMQLCRCLVFFCLFRAFGVDVAFAYFILYIPLVFLATTVPVSIGGLGVREAALVVFFADLGVPIEVCVAAGILLHGMQLLLSALVAALWFASTIVVRDRPVAPPQG